MLDELSLLRNRILELESEVERLTSLVESKSQSDEEIICLQEISKLKKISDKYGLTKDEAQLLDIYVKNLQIIRKTNVVEEKPKTKKLKDPAELFKLVQSEGK
jgi:hypothetical protein